MRFSIEVDMSIQKKTNKFDKLAEENLINYQTDL